MKFEDFRKREFARTAIWVTGPLSVTLMLYGIVFDYSVMGFGQVPKLWIYWRVGTVGLSILSGFYYFFFGNLKWPELPCYLVSVYVLIFLHKTVVVSGYEDSLYFCAYIQLILVASVLPFNRMSLLTYIFGVIAFYLYAVCSGGRTLYVAISSVGFISVIGFSATGILIFESIFRSKKNQFKLIADLSLENSSRKKEIENLVAQKLKNERSLARAELATQIIHDIRSPMSALNVASAENLETSKKLELISAAVRRMTEITGQLLNFSTGSNLSGIEKLTIGQIVNEILAEKRQIASNIVFLTDGDSLLQVNLDHSIQLKRLLSNLLDNSIQASKAGNSITTKISQSNDELTLEVDDCGEGINPELADKLLYEPIDSKKSSGFGIGLFTANSYASSVGGHMKIVSKQSKGTRVTVTFPIKSLT
jgi:signal transduction histidine kinase